MKIFKLLILTCGLIALASCGKPPTPDNNAPAMNQATTETINDDVNIDFAANSVVYFDFDVSTPKSSETGKITNQVKWLLAHPEVTGITVEGHADKFGTREYNIALGERRANSIKNILVRAGIAANKIKVVSFGKEKPADANDQSKNRRTLTRVSR